MPWSESDAVRYRPGRCTAHSQPRGSGGLARGRRESVRPPDGVVGYSAAQPMPEGVNTATLSPCCAPTRRCPRRTSRSGFVPFTRRCSPNGARASEVLGLRGADLDWANSRSGSTGKGTGAPQWLPRSSDALVWLHLYLADLGDAVAPNESIWWTPRPRDHGDGLRRRRPSAMRPQRRSTLYENHPASSPTALTRHDLPA
jgi:hypothetical protein